MAIQEYTPNHKIDLSMEEGNVFGLMGMAISLSKELEKDSKAIVKEKMASDYGNSVYVFDREFYEIILPKCMSMKEVRDSYLKTKMNE